MPSFAMLQQRAGSLLLSAGLLGTCRRSNTPLGSLVMEKVNGKGKWPDCVPICLLGIATWLCTLNWCNNGRDVILVTSILGRLVGEFISLFPADPSVSLVWGFWWFLVAYLQCWKPVSASFACDTMRRRKQHVKRKRIKRKLKFKPNDVILATARGPVRRKVQPKSWNPTCGSTTWLRLTIPSVSIALE